MKRILALLLVLVLIFSVVACDKKQEEKKEEPKKVEKKEEKKEKKQEEKIKIIASLYPQYDFVKEIAKDKVDVRLILKPGVESHSFEPTPQDIVDIKKANIFIYTGKHMEPWVEKLITKGDKTEALVVDVSKGIEIIETDDDDDHDHDHKHEHDKDKKDEHDHKHDPHIWLDLNNAKLMVETIKDALVKIDAKNKDFYQKNAKEYIAKLDKLDKEYKEAVKTFKSKKIVSGGHFAFAYLVKRYDLEYITPYKGFSPNAEPSAKNLAKLVKFIKDNKVKAIYYEELLDPKIAKMLSKETGAKMLLLHAAHNVSKEELDKGVSYLSIMSQNLKNLKEGLGE